MSKSGSILMSVKARGFARARCKDCGDDYLIAFSCKARGACPSCNTRRMVEIAAHLVDHVIPPVPVRQWVLSLPKRVRGFLHRYPALAGNVLRIFLEEVERALRRQCPGAGAKARTGAVLFPHRFGASLNAHYHFHACVIEGLYEAEGEGVRRGGALSPGRAAERSGHRAGARARASAGAQGLRALGAAGSGCAR